MISRLLSFRRITTALAIILFPCWSLNVSAETTSTDLSQIKVVVRTIKASGVKGTPTNPSKADSEISVEESLTDLKPKLAMLPFSSFHLIASKEGQISLKKKESIRLPNGQMLFFRPMYMDRERVGMWLSWKDTDGSDILNTRLHFDADESVMTGTDYHDDEGRILAIRAVKISPDAQN
jgi:hypothetical protein